MSERSYLFVPGNRPDRFEKAWNSGADAVILDLEDAVPPDQKGFARKAVSAWLTKDKAVYVRVNGVGTEWFTKDVRAILKPGLKGVFLPKAENKGQVELLSGSLLQSMVVVPTIETAVGLYNVTDLASASKVVRLAFGSVDFQLDTGIKGEEQALLYARSKIVITSRVRALLPPIDGVTTAIDNEERLVEDVRKSVDLGFGAKLCIHPKQIKAVNLGFLPDENEIHWAEKVLAAASAAGGAATRLGGELVDKPVIDKAERIIALYERSKVNNSDKD